MNVDAPHAPAPPQRRTSQRRVQTAAVRSRIRPYAAIAPALLVVGVILAYPMLRILWQAFVDADGAFNNFASFRRLLDEQVFLTSLRYTGLFVVVTVAAEVVVGIGAALLLDRLKRTKALVAGLVMLPYLVANIAAGFIWRLMFSYDVGIINYLLSLVGISPINWLASATPAFWATVITEVWRSMPFMTLIVLAGLAAIPQETKEAAYVDGASRARAFWHVTLPLLSPAISVGLIFSTVFKLRLFDVPFILTGGGPGSSTTPLGLLVHRVFFRYFDNGYAAAISVVLLVIGAVVSFVYLKYVYREIEY